MTSNWLWVADPNIDKGTPHLHRIMGQLQCIMGSRDRWNFHRFSKPLTVPLHNPKENVCLHGMYEETVKQSRQVRSMLTCIFNSLNSLGHIRVNRLCHRWLGQLYGNYMDQWWLFVYDGIRNKSRWYLNVITIALSQVIRFGSIVCKISCSLFGSMCSWVHRIIIYFM